MAPRWKGPGFLTLVFRGGAVLEIRVERFRCPTQQTIGPEVPGIEWDGDHPQLLSVGWDEVVATTFRPFEATS